MSKEQISLSCLSWYNIMHIFNTESLKDGCRRSRWAICILDCPKVLFDTFIYSKYTLMYILLNCDNRLTLKWFFLIFLTSTYPDEDTGASILEDDDTDYNASLDSGLDEINKFDEETNSEEDQVNQAVKLLVLDDDNIQSHPSQNYS